MNPETVGPLFVHPGDVGEPIFWVLPAGFAVAGALVCVVGLVRGRLDKTLLVSGVIFVPAIAYTLSDFVLMSRSKATSFCTSCHVMQPVADSTHDADNGSLAAIHVTRGAVPTATSCYTCHSGYGIWGGVNAKVAGIRHMVSTVTGNYEFPLQLRGPYDISSCLACHAESAEFRSETAMPVHEAVAEALLSGEMGCAGACHPQAHPAESLSGELAQR